RNGVAKRLIGMSGMSAPAEADFQAIEAVVAATERGRSFLAEYARRAHHDDAARLVSAIERLEARAAPAEAERARQRQQAERTTELLQHLREVLKDLRQLADARLRVRALEARPPGSAPARTGGLESRFAALVRLDEQEIESGLKLFG